MYFFLLNKDRPKYQCKWWPLSPMCVPKLVNEVEFSWEFEKCPGCIVRSKHVVLCLEFLKILHMYLPNKYMVLVNHATCHFHDVLLLLGRFSLVWSWSRCSQECKKKLVKHMLSECLTNVFMMEKFWVLF